MPFPEYLTLVEFKKLPVEHIEHVSSNFSLPLTFNYTPNFRTFPFHYGNL